MQPLLLTGQERAALLRRLSAVARLSRRREQCAAQAMVAGRGLITDTGYSTHEGIAPPAQRPVPSPARADRRLRSSTSRPLPLQRAQPLPARMARRSCDCSEQKETSLRTRRVAEAWLGWMPGWAWAVVWTRMATVRACAAAAGGDGQSAAGSLACRRCFARAAFGSARASHAAARERCTRAVKQVPLRSFNRVPGSSAGIAPQRKPYMHIYICVFKQRGGAHHGNARPPGHCGLC